MLWPLFVWWAWDRAATLLAGTIGEGAALASVRSVGLGFANDCGGGHD